MAPSAADKVAAFGFEGVGTELVASPARAAALAAWLISSTGAAAAGAGEMSLALGGGRSALAGIGTAAGAGEISRASGGGTSALAGVGTAAESSASLAAKALLPEGLNAKAKATAVPAKRPSNRDFRIEFSKRPAFPSDQLSAIKVNIRLACRLVLARPAIPTKNRRQIRGFAPQIKQI
jgi:hypothetical protein